MEVCIHCNTNLIVGLTWWQSSANDGKRICIVCRTAQNKNWLLNASPEKVAEIKRKHNHSSALSNYRVKQAIIDMFGSKCIMCGEQAWQFLTLDHILNDGNVDRR